MIYLLCMFYCIQRQKNDETEEKRLARMKEARKQGVKLLKHFRQLYAGQMTSSREVVDMREYETYKPPLETYLAEREGKLQIN